MNTTKKQLCKMTAKASGNFFTTVEPVVEAFLKQVSHMLEQGHTIEIRGFGSFYTLKSKPRPARNPRTGEPVFIAPARKARFQFSPLIYPKRKGIKNANT